MAFTRRGAINRHAEAHRAGVGGGTQHKCSPGPSRKNPIPARTAHGQNTIDLQGTYGLPQPGLASGLEIAPSSPGLVPTLSFIDTPFFKSLTMTNFALVGPQSTDPFFYPFNAYSITIENVFTPFPITGLARATLGMSGNYVPLSAGAIIPH
jgi:hypothetical protein